MIFMTDVLVSESETFSVGCQMVVKKFVNFVMDMYFTWFRGEWLDILWCSVCLCLTFVTFFVKKYFFSAYQL